MKLHELTETAYLSTMTAISLQMLMHIVMKC